MSDSIPVAGRLGAVKYMFVNGTGLVDDPYRLLCDVVVQDPKSEAIDLYACSPLGSTVLAVDAILGSDVINVTDSTGAVLYTCVDIKENGHVFQSLLGDISGNQLTLKSPVDYPFTSGAEVCFGQWDFSTANGTLESPILFSAGPPIGVKWHIYTLCVAIDDNSAMDDTKFGGIDALANGFYCHQVNGIHKQLFLVSNNAGFREYSFDTEYPAKVPAGAYSFGAKKNFRNENGVVIELDGDKGDRLEIPIVDDLTSLTKLTLTIHGHAVVD